MTSSCGPDADRPIAEQAAHWVMLLTAGDESERAQARRDFEAWKRADARHAAEAASLEQVIGQIQSVRNSAGGNASPPRAALAATFKQSLKRRRIKRAGAALVLALALAGPAWLALHAWPASYLMADVRSAAGQWETRQLSDGTLITLNGASAVNLRYDEQRRAIELLQGEMLVDVAKDAARPFLVETRHGSIRALGTRFIVEQRGDATVLSMLESRVSVRSAAEQTADDENAAVVEAGQRVRVTADAVGPIEAIDARALDEAWRNHQLVALDQPLAKVLDELARHRPGHIHYDREQIRGIRVNAVLPLDDTDQALKLLQASFPALRVRTLTSWLVLVDQPTAP